MRIAIVGATGQVGVVLRSILAGRSLPVDSMRYLASARSAGTILPWDNHDVVVEDAETADLTGIDLAASLQSPTEGQLVGVLEVAAHRETAGDPRHLHRQRLEQRRQVHGRGVTLDVGVGAQDHLGDAFTVDARQQLADLQLIGADPLDGTDGAHEHVVAAAVLAGLLHGHDVAGLLNHAHDGGVPALVRADRALRPLGDVEAASAEGDALLHLGDGTGQPHRILLGQLQEVERDALRRLGADAGQPAELVDQILDGAGVQAAPSGKWGGRSVNRRAARRGRHPCRGHPWPAG